MDVFKAMRFDAVFINVGRGNLYQEEDLIRALKEKFIAGACSMTLPAREINEVNYDPLSFYLLGKKNKEGELIRLAYTLEKSMNLVVKPSWLKDR